MIRIQNLLRKQNRNAFKLILVLVILVLSSSSVWPQNMYMQSLGMPKIGWQLMDLKADGFLGISSDKVYTNLLKNKKASPVIVAVIDGGIDIDHEDLRNAIFINRKEISANRKDDDGNGYVDDIRGWNFMGSTKGSFHYDNMEVVRQLRKELKDDPKSDKIMALKAELKSKLAPLNNAVLESDQKIALLNKILSNLRKSNPEANDFRNYKYRNFSEEQLLVEIVAALKIDPDFRNYQRQVENRNQHLKGQVNYLLNIDYDPRAGNEEFNGRYYGNSDAKGLDPVHGTHVAGIIAADRSNQIGMRGITDQVKIMPLRAIPNGDALDRDIAFAIRYAVDNGARIINMSFSKFTSGDRETVDDAVRYAMLKDVLIIHGAGNDGKKNETSLKYPNREYLNGGVANAWIEVGASGYKDDERIVTGFSNYGKDAVDVFAPGVAIYSTLPGNKYGYESGTSMAAPVVAGLAAMIRAYYPKLTALQVKDIIMKSVTRINHDVIDYSTGVKVPFSEICRSGGIVNAWNAFRLAGNLKLTKE